MVCLYFFFFFFCNSRSSLPLCSLSFMWLPGAENLSVSCQRFQLCSVPLSALKNLLFHTHELHCLWQWLEWALSGHRAYVRLYFCMDARVAVWQMGSNMAHLCPDRCVTAHHSEPEERRKKLKNIWTRVAAFTPLPASKLF